MIQKLRLKFIALTLLSVFVLLSVIVTGMDLLSYRSVVDDADTILSLLSQNHGAFPKGGAANRIGSRTGCRRSFPMNPGSSPSC